MAKSQSLHTHPHIMALQMPSVCSITLSQIPPNPPMPTSQIFPNPVMVLNQCPPCSPSLAPNTPSQLSPSPAQEDYNAGSH